MKRLSILLMLLSVGFIVNAQNDYGGKGVISQVINGDGWLRPVEGGRGGGMSDGGNNIIKVKLDGIMDMKIGLGYERVLTEKVTFGIDALYQLPQKSDNTGLINFKLLYDQVLDSDPELKEKIDSIFPSGNYGLTGANLSRWYVMPEVRYYFREAPKGFYTGLFFKYRELSYTNGFEYNNEGTNENYKYNVDMNMNTASIGLGLGLQTFLTKNISLDLYFFGVQFSSNIGGLTLTSTGIPITGTIQSGTQDVVNFVNENLPVKNILRVKDINNDIIDLESRFTSPSIRLPSLRLGIRF
jgi:hypothetical protein